MFIPPRILQTSLRGFKKHNFLADKRWIDKFLWKAEEEWPASSLDSNIAADDPEVKTEITTNAVIDAVEDTP